jgi:UDP:flavonoid glycosyltransferase YjiC (YdhE family)
MGKPTIVVPFFGDQPWWGRQVSTRGAGPDPIPVKTLTSENLADAIKFTKTQEALASAGRMGEDIKKEVSAIRPFASVGLNV